LGWAQRIQMDQPTESNCLGRLVPNRPTPLSLVVLSSSHLSRTRTLPWPGRAAAFPRPIPATTGAGVVWIYSALRWSTSPPPRFDSWGFSHSPQTWNPSWSPPSPGQPPANPGAVTCRYFSLWCSPVTPHLRLLYTLHMCLTAILASSDWLAAGRFRHRCLPVWPCHLSVHLLPAPNLHIAFRTNERTHAYLRVADGCWSMLPIDGGCCFYYLVLLRLARDGALMWLWPVVLDTDGRRCQRNLGVDVLVVLLWWLWWWCCCSHCILDLDAGGTVPRTQPRRQRLWLLLYCNVSYSSLLSLYPWIGG
jgi:hypothetical protein